MSLRARAKSRAPVSPDREPPLHDAHTELLECPHCGLVQRAGESLPGHVTVCTRCDSRLHGRTPPVRGLAPVCASAAALLLLVGLAEPVFELHLLGRYAAASVITGPRMLVHTGLPELALVVFLTLLIAPLLHLSILGLALLGSHMHRPPRFMFWSLGLIETTRRWSMADVFLLAALVCYVRLRAWAHVEVGSAIIALAALTLVTVATEWALDLPTLWMRMPWHSAPPPSASGPQIACGWCRLVSFAREGTECPRCGRTLHIRKRRSLTRATTLLLSATFLCVPANVLPVMNMIRFGRSEENTIYSGVLELTRADLWGLAVLIFVASIVIPLIKIVALAFLLWSTKRGASEHLRARTRTFVFVQSIGRWSLVDVFAVTIMVSLVHLGILASVLPRYGAVAFCGVVILTMFATEAFDPRLMWDAAGLNGERLREHAA